MAWLQSLFLTDDDVMQTEFTCIKRLGAGHKADLQIGKDDASTNVDEPRKLCGWRKVQMEGLRTRSVLWSLPPAPRDCPQVAFQIQLS